MALNAVGDSSGVQHISRRVSEGAQSSFYGRETIELLVRKDLSRLLCQPSWLAYRVTAS